MTYKFAEHFDKLAPWWLTIGEGGLLIRSLLSGVDDTISRCYQSLLARFPGHCQPDALQYIGHDRKIVRGINEPDLAYAARLIRWLDDHATRGNPFALMGQLQAYCQAPVMIRTVDNSGNWSTLAGDGTKSVSLARANWNWDGGTTQWSRFWVIIYPVGGVTPWGIDGTFGDGALFGDGGTWGTTATSDQVETVRAIVDDWKPAGTRCVNIILAFDPASFFPGSSTGLPDGTWGSWGYYDSGVKRPHRLVTARYWEGSRT